MLCNIKPTLLFVNLLGAKHKSFELGEISVVSGSMVERTSLQDFNHKSPYDGFFKTLNRCQKAASVNLAGEGGTY